MKSWQIQSTDPSKINPFQLTEYMQQQMELQGAGGSIFDEISFDNWDTQNFSVEIIEDKAKNASDTKEKNFYELLKDVFSVDKIRKEIDENGDGILQDSEVKGFLSDVKSLDGKAENLSMKDFELALNNMGIDLSKDAPAKQEAAQEAQKPEEAQAAEQPQAVEQASNSQGNYNGGGGSGGGVSSPSGSSNVQKTYETMSLEELNSEKTGMEQTIQDKRDKLAKIVNGTSEELTQAKADVEQAKQDMYTAIKNDEAVKELEQSFEEQTNALEQRENSIAQKDSEITAQESSVSQISNSLESLKSAKSSLPAKTDKNKAEVEARESALQSQIDAKQTELDNANQKLTDLKAEKTKLENEPETIAQAEQKLAELKNQILSSCSDATKTAIQNYDSKKQAFEQLKTEKATAAQSDLDTSIQELSKIENAIQTKENSKAVSGPLADKLNEEFEGVLAGKGEDIVAAAEKYGIDPALFAAIIKQETGSGRSIDEHNNPGGIMGSSGLRTYSSIDEGLDSMASLLKRGYYDEGRTTPDTIGPKYCPVGASNDPGSLNQYWIPNVTKFYEEFKSLG